MAFRINNILLSDYGILPGQVPGGNISVGGCFDLPKRVGDTHREWEEEMEPYVDADEIFFAGRDIEFIGVILGSRNSAISAINSLKSAISAFTDLVDFESDYGTFSVKVDTITVKSHHEGVSVISIKMSEPEPVLTGGTLPSTGNVQNYKVDNIPLASFGVYVSKVTGKADLPKGKKENFTIWGKEGYQVTNHKANEVIIKAAVASTGYSDFTNKIKALWLLFSSAGMRAVRLNDYVTIESFMVDGFKVKNVHKTSNQMIGEITIKVLSTNEYMTFYKVEDTGNYILATEEGKILVF